MAKKKSKVTISVDDGPSKQTLKALLKAYNDAIDNLPKIIRQVGDKYNNIVYNKLSEIAEDAIDNFYEYKAKVYEEKYNNRKGDLYNAYRINATDDDWSIDLGPEFMQHKHHQSNEFIYENSFVHGYHGGSIGEDDYVEVTEPFYRGPYGKWTYWTYPAAQDEVSPEEYILKQDIDGLLDAQRKLAGNEFMDIFGKYMNAINEIVIKL